MRTAGGMGGPVGTAQAPLSLAGSSASSALGYLLGWDSRPTSPGTAWSVRPHHVACSLGLGGGREVTPAWSRPAGTALTLTPDALVTDPTSPGPGPPCSQPPPRGGHTPSAQVLPGGLRSGSGSGPAQAQEGGQQAGRFSPPLRPARAPAARGVGPARAGGAAKPARALPEGGPCLSRAPWAGQQDRG